MVGEDIVDDTRQGVDMTATNGSIAHAEGHQEEPMPKTTARLLHLFLQILNDDQICGGIGSTLLLPTLGVVGCFAFYPSFGTTPWRIAFAVLANFTLFGTLGSVLGGLAAYNYTSRMFLLIGVLIGLPTGIIVLGGMFGVMIAIVCILSGVVILKLLRRLIESLDKSHKR